MRSVRTTEHARGDGRRASIRVLIATEHALLADGIQALAQERTWLLTRTVNDDRAMAATMQSWLPAVVLVDACERVQRVLDAAALCGDGVEVATVVLAPDEPAQVRAALLAGARGFVPLGASADSLFACIEAVARGEWGLPRRFIGTLVADYLQAHGERQPPTIPLDVRERQILGYLAGGASAARIGERLFLSDGAIRTELRILKRKFGVASRARLVALALQHGVTPDYGLRSAAPATPGERDDADTA